MSCRLFCRHFSHFKDYLYLPLQRVKKLYTFNKKILKFKKKIRKF